MQNETRNLDNEINDLEINDAAEIKGGPTHQSNRDLILRSTVAEGRGDDDTMRGFTLNHNENVSEDSDADAQILTDLTIDSETENAIKGGLLPAVQKVREARLLHQPLIPAEA